MQETSRVSQLVEGEGKWRAKQELNGRHSLLSRSALDVKLFCDTVGRLEVSQLTGSGEEVSRKAHNLQVVGALPTSPTNCFYC